ncbi:MAG: hypothetical protein M3Y86_05685 [Verrucomicrobiota bacterium]|nr:hypothetical protein [Verrucomicrobiota bacterium]
MNEPPLAQIDKQAAAQAAGVLAQVKPLKKLVIAIHGIGDQYRHATIQSVVTRFGRYFDFPAAVPLGSFHSPSTKLSAFSFQSPTGRSTPIPPALAEIGFLEVYWAHIPRGVQKEGYIIEEAKAWARTVAERVRLNYGQDLRRDLDIREQDFRSAAAILQEMIETIAILGNLCFLAEKAGLFKFDLDELLTAYLGDVQLVADFASYRKEIVQRLRDILDPLWAALQAEDQAPEIYIVAHSEGTVVAFMGLLDAMSQTNPADRPAWIDSVRGFMTIGSPIDKHLILWPDIWEPFFKARDPQGREASPANPPIKRPIRWRNYYDYGDPVGFDLDTVRDWMGEKEHYWKNAFEFEREDDFGFGRYVLPGAAHNEYWGDRVVFGHFIQNVMEIDPVKGWSFAKGPHSRWWAMAGSWVIPYLLGFAIVYSGTYLLYKSLRAYVAPTAAEEAAAVPGSTSPDAATASDSYALQWWHQWKEAKP